MSQLRKAAVYLFSCLLILVVAAPVIGADGSLLPATVCKDRNTAVASYYATINSAPAGLRDLIKRFPKGGDIHQHLSGSIMPDDYIMMAIKDGSCYGQAPNDSSRYAIGLLGKNGSCDTGYTPLNKETDMRKLVASLSMAGFDFENNEIKAGHDQFFGTFQRFGAVSGSDSNRAQMLKKVLEQASRDHVSYVETMLSFQSAAIGVLASSIKTKFTDIDLEDETKYDQIFQHLQDMGLQDVVRAAQNDLSLYSGRTKSGMNCTGPGRSPVCDVSFAFLAEVNRNSSKVDQTGVKTADLAKFFAQTALSFMLSKSDPRVVGVNLVSGEDDPISMNNFDRHMRIFSYFHRVYPDVSIALHAGELTPCFIGKDSNAFMKHLTGSLDAGAKRLGHVVSFSYLDKSDKEMVRQKILNQKALVEIMFTSNAQILGVTGDEHPFAVLYRDYPVPVSFATDDEGVSVAQFSDEWVYAVQQYKLRYDDLVKLARNSLEHGFMKGGSLWEDVNGGKPVEACRNKATGALKSSDSCRKFLDANRKAYLQWKLESDLRNFRKRNHSRLVKYRLI